MSDFTRPLAFEHAVEAGRVKTKANKTRNLHAKAARVARGSPEVMVKITGFTKGGGHLKAHIAYISRHAKLELETDRGEVLDTRESIQQLAAQWKESFGTHTRRASQRDAMSLMLSMPEGTPEEGVRSAARAFARAASHRKCSGSPPLGAGSSPANRPAGVDSRPPGSARAASLLDCAC